VKRLRKLAQRSIDDVFQELSYLHERGELTDRDFAQASTIYADASRELEARLRRAYRRANCKRRRAA